MRNNDAMTKIVSSAYVSSFDQRDVSVPGTVASFIGVELSLDLVVRT